MDVDQLTASNFRRLRELKNWSQEALANEARTRIGLEWTRDHVAAIERGARRLSVGELFALGYLLGYPLDEFFAGGDEQWIELTPGFRAKGLVGAARAGGLSETEGPLDRDNAAFMAEREAKMTAQERAEREARGQAEQKAAKALGVDRIVLFGAAKALWGRSLSAERDRRVAERAEPGASPRALQALRGHVTRELYAELRAVLESGRGRARK